MLVKLTGERFCPKVSPGKLMLLASASVKRGFLIAAALILSPAFVVGFAALAAADWRPVGATANGDKVSVSTISVPRRGPRTAWVRVEYKEPITLPQGGPFVELRAHVRFNCARGSIVTNAEWFYSRGPAGRPVVSKKAVRDDQFGEASEGGFAGLVRDFVCKQK